VQLYSHTCAWLKHRAVCQIRTLEGVVEREAVPKDDANLCALTKARHPCRLACLDIRT
jgi:hypothetical protein